MLLFFDTETTGLPKNWKAPVTDVNNWPRLVQIAWMVFDRDGQAISSADHIIRPSGFTIPKGAEQIHGISTQKASDEGRPVEDVLEEFFQQIGKAKYIVAHNMNFDEKIAGAEFFRLGRADVFKGKDKICTMAASTDFCRIPGPYGYKWPTLSELHKKLFKADFEEAHDASVDVSITAKCFWELIKRQAIRLDTKK
jgi:DNA polymerase-3 subunit epsilon